MNNHLTNRHAPMHGQGYQPGVDEPHDFLDTLLDIVCFGVIIAALTGVAWPLIAWAFGKV